MTTTPEKLARETALIDQAWEAIEHGLAFEGVRIGKDILHKLVLDAIRPLVEENARLRIRLEQLLAWRASIINQTETKP